MLPETISIWSIKSLAILSLHLILNLIMYLDVLYSCRVLHFSNLLVILDYIHLLSMVLRMIIMYLQYVLINRIIVLIVKVHFHVVF